MVTAEHVFTETVLSLPASERLRLATLILEDLTRSSASVLDYSDHWTDQDIQDFTTFSAKYADDSLDAE